MPTVLIIGPYRFHFYSREENEPAHIHVSRDDFEAKYWLDPVRLARNVGFASHELGKIKTLIDQNQELLTLSWRTHHES